MKRKGIKIRLLTSVAVIVAVTVGVFTAMVATTSSTASAYPGYTEACDGSCHGHTYHGGNLRITTDTGSKTVAPGETFAVGISFTGGGTSRTEVNWPNVADNTLFAPNPRVPFSARAATTSTSSTLTAPTAIGTYTVRVYSSQRSPTTETDYKDMTINVAAAPTTYTITASAGTNGSINPSGATTVNSGATQGYTIAAGTGYHVADVLVDGTSVGAITSYSFTNVAADHTIAASFAANDVTPTTYTITSSAGGNGSITPLGATTVNSGATQGYTIAAGTGYHVADVLVDGTSVGAITSYSFTNVTADHTIAASFAANDVTATYTITASAGNHGSISPRRAVSVNAGSSQTFTMTARRGYRISSVVVDGRSVGAVSTYPFTNVTANHTISVRFSPRGDRGDSHSDDNDRESRDSHGDNRDGDGNGEHSDD